MEAERTDTQCTEVTEVKKPTKLTLQEAMSLKARLHKLSYEEQGAFRESASYSYPSTEETTKDRFKPLIGWEQRLSKMAEINTDAVVLGHLIAVANTTVLIPTKDLIGADLTIGQAIEFNKSIRDYSRMLRGYVNRKPVSFDNMSVAKGATVYTEMLIQADEARKKADAYEAMAERISAEIDVANIRTELEFEGLHKYI